MGGEWGVSGVSGDEWGWVGMGGDKLGEFGSALALALALAQLFTVVLQ